MLNTHIQSLPPIAKQILGAAVGAVTALVLYGVYDLASPYLPEISFGESNDVIEEPMHAAATGEKWNQVIEIAKKELRSGNE